MPPPLEQQITFLYAQDTAACRAFYGGVLGLELVQDQGACAIYAVAGRRGFIGVCAARGPRQAEDPRHQGGVVLTLVSAEVAAWHAHLLAAGVAPAGPPERNAATGITHFFFHDPAGYLLEIQRFERPDWPTPG